MVVPDRVDVENMVLLRFDGWRARVRLVWIFAPLGWSWLCTLAVGRDVLLCRDPLPFMQEFRDMAAGKHRRSR